MPDERGRCPYCGRAAEAAAEAASEADGGAAAPEAGDVSICFGCGRLALFTGRALEVRRPTDDERAALLRDVDVRAALRAWRAVVDGA